MTWETLAKSAIQTGRTTRMLSDAQKLAAEGMQVYVVFYNMDFAEDARKRQPPHPLVAYLSWDTIRTQRPDFDPASCKLRNGRGVVLVDHSVIEMRYRGLLEMLHRFDGKLPWTP